MNSLQCHLPLPFPAFFKYFSQFKGFYVLTFMDKYSTMKKHVISESSVSFSDKYIKNNKLEKDYIRRCTLWLTLNLQKKEY